MPNETREPKKSLQDFSHFYSWNSLTNILIPQDMNTITEKCLIHQIGLYISILVGGNILVIDFFLTYIYSVCFSISHIQCN